MSNISIICTVKNGEKTIKNTIDSVLKQTFKEWEFIIVDDGSTDATAKVLLQYAEDHNRIKVIETEGLGRGKALNLAVNNSNGDYIVNIDADDLMHPEKLDLQYNLIDCNPNYFLLSSDAYIFHGNEIPTWKKIDREGIKVKNTSQKNLIKNQVNHSSVIMRKDILLKIGGYSEHRKSQFDYELWLRSAHMGYELGKINRQLVGKRIHSEQSFEKKRASHLLRSLKLQAKYIFKSKKLYLLVFPLGRMILGIFPFKLRQKLNGVLRI